MVTHPKAGEIVWNNVKDNAVGEKDEYREIGLRGFDYKPFKEEGGGRREVLRGNIWISIFEASN